MKLEGVWTAIWTPTDVHGKVIEAAIEEHVSFLKRSGVDGILVGGSTGEFSRLELMQRQYLLAYIRKYAGPLRPIVNISHTIIDNVKALAQGAIDQGADAVLVLPPSYYQVSQEDIGAYFEHVAAFTKDLPFLLYNFPECVRNTVELPTISQLANKIPLAGIKHSGSHFEYLGDLAKVQSKRPFSVFTGAETKLFDALQLGAKGTIGALSNALPEIVVQLYANAARGDDHKQQEKKLEDVTKIISRLNFPHNIAALMQARGFRTGPPKTPCSQSTLSEKETVINELKTFLR